MGIRKLLQRGTRAPAKERGHQEALRVDRRLAGGGNALAATAGRHMEAKAFVSAAETWGRARDRFADAGDLPAAREAQLGRVRALLGVVRISRLALQARVETDLAERRAAPGMAGAHLVDVASLARRAHHTTDAPWADVALAELRSFVPLMALRFGPGIGDYRRSLLRQWVDEHERMAGTIAIQLGRLPPRPIE